MSDRGWRRITEGAPFFPLFVLFGLNAVDELDRAAFNILLPEIRDHFGLSNEGALGVVALLSPVAVLVGLPLAFYADRLRRSRIAVGGAAVWGAFSFLTALAPNLPSLVVARAGSGMGKAVNYPTHNSLLADYYPVDVRAKVFAFHQSANSVGNIIGPAVAGILAAAFSWRAPFVAFAFFTGAFVLLGMRLKDPVRGIQDRLAVGADAETAAIADVPPKFGESWRLLYTVVTLRRLYFSLPLLAGSIIGLQSVMALFYEEVYGLDTVERGIVFALDEPFQIIGLVIGAPIAQRLMRRDPGLALRFLAYISVGVAATIAVVAISPNLFVAIPAGWVRALVGSLLTPTIVAVFSLVIPGRIRSLGFAVFSVWALPGLVVLPIVGGIGDDYGFRWAILVLIPIYLAGAFVVSTAAPHVARDIENNRRWSLLEAKGRLDRTRLQEAIARGDAGVADVPMVDAKNIDFSYGPVQVLFDVSLEIRRGAKIALLGTNGAGKSTLLKVVSGLASPDIGTGGTVWFDGEDVTYMLPEDRVLLGMVMIGGGRATFQSLTVAENLRMGAYPVLADRELVNHRVDEVLELFPKLRPRLGQRAGTLSGGEQQMMAIGRALIANPKLLIIDELSLGLAPVVVQDILRSVDEIVSRGTTLLLVEQSLNIALGVTEHAYFMEKGAIRFSGPTAELAERPDLVRSVFFGNRS
ncbi:MAG TPA: MFS transporter [Acidimicrobiales bacterium]|nr:MFS transporter [Acidimicrobiales bacterium]